MVSRVSPSASHKPMMLFGKAELALIGITIMWGATFLIVQKALSSSGPLFFVGLRFATAALITVIISRSALTKITPKELMAGSAIGLGIFLGYTLQTMGLQYIPSSTSAFITAAYVPLVPLLQWLILKRRPHLMSWLGVILAFVGLLLLAGPKPGISPGRGEILTLISTLAIAMEIVLISRWANEVDALRVTVVQLAVTSALAFAFMTPAGEHLPGFSWLLISCACGLGVMSAVIQLVMNWAQRTVSATRATLIYAGEPIWAGAVGRLAGERLPATAWAGAALIVAGVIISEIRFRTVKSTSTEGLVPGSHLNAAVASSPERIDQQSV